jgi:hypothetical protein
MPQWSQCTSIASSVGKLILPTNGDQRTGNGLRGLRRGQGSGTLSHSLQPLWAVNKLPYDWAQLLFDFLVRQDNRAALIR